MPLTRNDARASFVIAAGRAEADVRLLSRHSTKRS